MGSQSLIILLRRLGRNKLSAFLNIVGLSVGIAVSVAIFVIIRNELSIDTFHKNHDRIYRVVSTETYRNGKVEYDGCVPIPLGETLEKEFPPAEKVTSLWRVGYEEFQLADAAEKRFRTDGVNYVEPSLFEIFDFPFLSGEPHTALGQPNTMVLSRSTADVWFGSWKNAIGKTVLFGLGKDPYKVTGIIEDVPTNSDLQMKILLSYITFKNDNLSAFSDPGNFDSFNSSSQCFFLLKKDQTIDAMNKLLPGFTARHYTPLAATSNTSNGSLFQPLKDMHFDERFYHFTTNGFTKPELWTIGFIGAFILLMACVNFVNLSTAQSLTRGKEIGVKKVLGSSPSILFRDFMIETGILVLLALLIGTVIAVSGWKYITTILRQDIPLFTFTSLVTIAFLLITGALLTLFAGSYPALIVSRFKPVTALKSNKPAANGKQILLRRGLIIFQFVIAQCLIVGTLVVNNQMTFFYTRPMGFDRDAIVTVNLPYTKDGKVRNEQLKQEVLRLQGVQSATLCNEPPSTDNSGSTYFTLQGHAEPENLKIAYRFVDSNYLSTFNIPIVAGRFPSANDSIRQIMLNETTVKTLGLTPNDILGKTLTWSSSDIYEIVGVVKDFHEGSLKAEILPMAVFASSKNFRRLAVKIRPASLAVTMPLLKKTYESRFPDNFFDAPFLDESIAAYYHSEEVVLTLMRIFAVLGIVISCLGLYGLVAFMTFQKTKEVGVRKVLGASASSIVYLFSSEFTLLIALSFLIATPVSYYFMNEWLQSFHYHINIEWGVFAISLVASVFLAWITVSYKAIKAATANPVNSLRSE